MPRIQHVIHLTIALSLTLSLGTGCGSSTPEEGTSVNEEKLAERVAELVLERMEREGASEDGAAAPTVEVDADTLVDAAGAPEAIERYRVPVAGDRPSRGGTEPLVTIVQFSDFECPFCGRVEPTLDRLLDRYGDRIRIVWRNNPLPMHRNAPMAHQAALEAYDQGGDEAFWRMHGALFENRNDLERADLERYAREQGLDMNEFRQALDTFEHEGIVEADQALAQEVGARGTPHFFINGRRLAGAQPYDEFAEMVDDEIRRAAALQREGVPRAALYSAFQAHTIEDQEPAPRRPSRPQPDPNAVYRIPVTDDMPQKGPDRALVTIIGIASFQCPFSSRVQDTLDQVEREYGNDVRILWMNNPLPFHHDAPLAHRAAMEVFAQGGDRKFWAYHDLLFENQRQLTRENLERWAQQVGGIRMARFRRALDRDAHQDVIDEQQRLARQLGATGTPSFFINGRNVRGAQPFEAFQRVIDEELAKARRMVREGTPRRRLYESIIEDGATSQVLTDTVEEPEVGPGPDDGTYEIPVPRDAPRTGSLEAPVVIQMFTDFECPFCSRVQPTLEQIEQEYGNRVTIVFRNYPLPFHQDAQLAHEAAMEVFRQGGNQKFWAYHDLLFQSQSDLSVQNLEALAQRVGGINMAQFRSALDTRRHEGRVERDKQAVQAAGARIGTPSFFINGHLTLGAQPFTVFRVRIDRALARP